MDNKMRMLTYAAEGETMKTMILMNKNTKVLSFLYNEDLSSIEKVLNIFHAEYAPIGTRDIHGKITRKAFSDWWEDRAVPDTRDGFKDVLLSMPSLSSAKLLEKCHGLSLSDQYWIREENSGLTWKEINFFDHDFSEDMGNLLMGDMKYQADHDLCSPDNSCGGDLKKKWKIIQGDRCLLKSGSHDFQQEPYNEVIATRLFERILNKGEYVPYTLYEENGRAYSCCKTMITAEEELVPAVYIDACRKQRNDESSYEHYIRMCESLQIPNARESINKMIVCDFILGNYDRHYGNFGAIRNVETLEWEGTAPIYDTGSSLGANLAAIDIRTRQYKAKPFRISPVRQLELVNDFSWYNEDELTGFEEEIREVLSHNPKMDQMRISAICHNVKENIAVVNFRKSHLSD